MTRHLFAQPWIVWLLLALPVLSLLAAWARLRGRQVLARFGDMTALFLGLVPSLTALAIAAAYRIYVGGPAALPGIIVMSISIGVGLLWRRFRAPRLDRISLAELYFFGLAVHLPTTALAWLTPAGFMFTALRSMTAALLIAAVAGVLAWQGNPLAGSRESSYYWPEVRQVTGEASVIACRVHSSTCPMRVAVSGSLARPSADRSRDATGLDT